MKRPMILLIASLLGCGGRVSLGDHDDDQQTPDAGSGAEGGATTSPTTGPRRTLDEFRGALVGVWEGNLTSDRTDEGGGMVLPAERVRVEFKETGALVGTCLEAFRWSSPGACSAFDMVSDGPSPYRVWQIDRLTAGYEGMGLVADRTNPDYVRLGLLHRVRLSADGARLEFSVLKHEGDDSPVHYWLTRVAR